MASQFIGLQMRVVLRDPPGYQLTGFVQDVEAGNSLTLAGVYVVSTKEYLPHMRIDALNIIDLSEMPKEQQQQQKKPLVLDDPATVQSPIFNSKTTSPSKSSFQDPAILSFGRPTSTETSSTTTRDKISRQPPIPPTLHSVQSAASENKAKEELGHSFKTMSIADTPQVKNVSVSPEATHGKRKARKRSSRRSRKATRDDDNTEGAPGSHGEGWRQTPILQSTSWSQQPSATLKRNGKARKDVTHNDWASEDVTEELPEFDFENNLAKFDKQALFDQMRKNDAIDEADRLVSHNRKPKPGTAGGKNLHYTENVLEIPSSTHNLDYWNSEADVGGVKDDEMLSGRDLRNGQSAKTADSKIGSSRRSQSRKASAVLGSQPLSQVSSGMRQPLPSRKSSPRSGYRSADLQQGQKTQPGLYLIPSNRRVESISTLQMLNLENIAANEVGFSESLMAENAGRGIAEVAVQALSDPALMVRYKMAGAAQIESSDISLLSNSVIAILAGNHKSSMRALVAGRHLRCKGFNVLVCLVGIERERDLLEEVRQQVQLYRNFGGKVLRKNEFFEHLRKTAPGSTATASGVSVSLIIDALLGLTMSFEELRVGDQATVYELMEWANRNEAFVLSIDVPSGIDPGTGKVAIIDGSQLFVKPRYVVAVGAPKRGLVEAVTPPDDDDPLALNGGVAQDEEWRLFIVDMGLGHSIWRKAGTKVRKGIDFDGRWVLEMKYQGAEAKSSDY